MLGAIVGDIVGSIYEGRSFKSKRFPLFRTESQFTDDTILTVAVADVLLNGGDYAAAYKRYFCRYPEAGWGGRFMLWGTSASDAPYGSFGNGSAMRVSPVGFARNTLAEVLAEARRSAEATHNHPEGIKGAQATAAAIFLARTGQDKTTIRDFVAKTFSYDLNRTLDQIRPGYDFDESCQGTVPEAITAFLESRDFEDAIRCAISLGGDSDTLACITGGIAEAFYGGVPTDIADEALARLDEPLRDVTEQFMTKYPAKSQG
jgi:ADP-ribosylglycohydrolase